MKNALKQMQYRFAVIYESSVIFSIEGLPNFGFPVLYWKVYSKFVQDETSFLRMHRISDIKFSGYPASLDTRFPSLVA